MEAVLSGGKGKIKNRNGGKPQVLLPKIALDSKIEGF